MEDDDAPNLHHSTLAMAQVPDPYTGRIIADRLKLSMCVGAGGMAKVYLAQQLDVARTVVVKLLRPMEASDLARRDLIARFHREARAVARLNHPNIVQVHFFGETEQGEPFLVMEFVAGRPLDVVLEQEGPLAIPRALKIMAQIAEAMTAAHEAGVVHRDLKPGNVMLMDGPADSPQIKVLDFGIAKMVEDPEDHTGLKQTSPLTMGGEVYGTPEYISPEQARGESVDARADLYALGCVGYELLTGCLVFEVTGKRYGHLVKHATEQPVGPAARAPHLNIPPQVDRLILRCLEKDPDARPQSAAQLQAHIEAVLAELARGPEAAPAEPPSDVEARPTPRRLWRYALPLIAGGALAAGALWWGARDPTDAAPTAALAPHRILIDAVVDAGPTRVSVVIQSAATDSDATTLLNGDALDGGVTKGAASGRPDAQVITTDRLYRGISVPSGTVILEAQPTTARLMIPMEYQRAYHIYRTRYFNPQRYFTSGEPIGRNASLTVLSQGWGAPFGTMMLRPMLDERGRPVPDQCEMIIDRRQPGRDLRRRR